MTSKIVQDIAFRKRKSIIKALRIALIFLVFGELYIIFSDRILYSISTDLPFLNKIQTYKGILFIIITSILIFFLVYKELLKQERYYSLLDKNEEKFRTIIKNSNIGVAYANIKGDLTYANDELLKILGYSSDELLRMNFSDFTHPEDLQNEIELYNKIIDGTIDSYRIEKRYISKTGNIIWVDLAVTCDRNQKGEIDRFIGWIMNITKRKNLESQLQLINRAVENSLNGFDIIDHNGKFIYANEAYLKMWGYDSLDEIIGTSPVTHSKTPDTSKDIIKTLKKKGQYKIEFEAKRKDGSLFNVMMYAHLDHDHSGNEIYLGTSMDISHRIKYESDLKNSRAFIEGILNNLHIGISVIDKEYKYLFINKTLQKLTGLRLEQVVGKNIFEIFPFFEKIGAKTLIDKAMKGEYTYTVDIRDQINPQSNKWFYTTYYPNKDADGNIIGIVSQIVNITDRKKAEQKLIEQNKEYESLNEELTKINEELTKAKESAERSNHLKTVFLNNMSHEIRTPMNGIVGFSSFMSEPDLSHEKRKYYSEILNNSCGQLLRIIDDILEISQLETKQVTLHKTVFSLNDLLMEIFAIFNLKSNEQAIPLYLNKGLSDIDSRIETDKSKLFKVISNLLENALKFTKEGYIEFGYNLESDKIVLYVKDTGIGISKGSLEIVFQRFVQEEKELSRQFGGLGIGLSIAKENSELLGGRISVQSEKGKGSTFYVTIPYTPVQDEMINSKKELATGTNKGYNNKKRVLIVEDEEVNYLYLEEVLKTEHANRIEVLRAEDGKTALNLCKDDGNIDLVFMDIKMPVMGGYEATKYIKKMYPELTIIALTAYSTEEDKEKAIQAGCTDFISKPVDKQQIFYVLDKYLWR